MVDERKLPAIFDMDTLVSSILRIGLLLSLGFLVIGFAWRWVETRHIQFDYELPRTNVLEFMEAELRLVSARQFRPRLFLNLGLAMLIFTPYVRVLASMLHFAFIKRNAKYTVFTGFVLATLTYSLFLR